MAIISDLFVSLSFTAALKVRDCVFSTCVFLLLLVERDWEIADNCWMKWMNEWTGRWLDSHLAIPTPIVNHSRLGANVLPTETSQLWHFLPGQSLCLLSFPTFLLPFSFFLLFLIWCVTGMTHYCLWPIAMGKWICFQIRELSVQLLWFLSPSPSPSSCCFSPTFVSCFEDTVPTFLRPPLSLSTGRDWSAFSVHSQPVQGFSIKQSSQASWPLLRWWHPIQSLHGK